MKLNKKKRMKFFKIASNMEIIFVLMIILILVIKWYNVRSDVEKTNFDQNVALAQIEQETSDYTTKCFFDSLKLKGKVYSQETITFSGFNYRVKNYDLDTFDVTNFTVDSVFKEYECLVKCKNESVCLYKKEICREFSNLSCIFVNNTIQIIDNNCDEFIIEGSLNRKICY